MRVQHTAVRFDTQEGEQIFDAKLTDLRVTWQFNVRSFVRLTMQGQVVERNVALYVAPDTEAETLTVGTQLLYSYKVNPQTVLYPVTRTITSTTTSSPISSSPTERSSRS